MNFKPQGWAVAKLKDLLDYIQPNPFIVKSTDYKDTYPTPVLTAGKSFIKGYTNETDGIFTKLPTIIFDDFTTATQFVNFPFKVKSSAMKILQPTSHLVNIKLAYYFMQTVHLNGETHKRFWISEYSQIPVPLAPLNEQKRILSKLEELLTDLDKGIEYLETTKQQLKVYRQAVLQWAFEGKFTRENVIVGEIPKGWKKDVLGRVCFKIQDGSHFSPKVQYNEPSKGLYKYITAKNIRNNYMDLSNVTYIDKEFHDSIFRRCNPEYGDVLLTKDGVNTGEITLNTLKEEFSLLSSVCLFKPKPKELTGEFLKYYIQSPLGSRLIKDSMTGTAIKRVILRKLKIAAIILPPLDEQQQIVKEIESRLSVCDKIEETIESSLLKAEALRLSIIKKAFEGKLVPQDPNDEPAEKLLERIRAHRKFQGKQENGKPKKKEKVKAEKKVKTKKATV